MTPALREIAVYERSVAASEARVWENVHDWEHLPWLHASSFSSIELEEQGAWGWRARIGGPPGRGRAPGSIRLELVVEGSRYVSRTLEGQGAGNEIWTTVTAVDERRTDIRVELHVPGEETADDARTASRFVALYTRLWDEDEAMMRHRSDELARRGGAPLAAPDPAPRDLGLVADLADGEPLLVEIEGRPFRVRRDQGEWLAHAASCPHWLGPLGTAEVRAGEVVCPWHGYRFDVRSGRRCDASGPMRLPPAPRVFEAEGHLWLEVSSRSDPTSQRARGAAPRDSPGDVATDAAIGLGANLADREASLRAAVAELEATPGIRVVAGSSLYETDPVGGPEQGAYLNGALRLETTLAPHELLARLQEIEAKAGRVRSGVRDEPRTLDLDLLLYGDRILATPDLVVPHPRLHERAFALEPLAEVAGEWVHPRLDVSVAELAARVRDPAAVRQQTLPTLTPPILVA